MSGPQMSGSQLHIYPYSHNFIFLCIEIFRFYISQSEMSQVQVKLEKLEEAEEKAKTAIQAIQQEIDESAKVMVAQNAEDQKQKEELEVCISI
jgi:hypothetical protein